MNSQDTIKRVSRLTAILTQLQTKRVVTATQLSKKFAVSLRTIYRDIQALEKAGVPISTEGGQGYSLMEGYKVPPVMFTESEAHALITAEQLVSKSKDSSLSTAYSTAIAKVKAVLQPDTQEKVELLSSRIAVSPMLETVHSSHSLALIQQALTSFQVLEITYRSAHKKEQTVRKIEPFAFYYSLEEHWLLIAYCQLRKDFRMFRLDHILTLRALDLRFTPHALTLEQYLADKQKKYLAND